MIAYFFDRSMEGLNYGFVNRAIVTGNFINSGTLFGANRSQKSGF